MPSVYQVYQASRQNIGRDVGLTSGLGCLREEVHHEIRPPRPIIRSYCVREFENASMRTRTSIGGVLLCFLSFLSLSSSSFLLLHVLFLEL